MNRRVLTISMLVSGREETTEKSLQSLQPLREVLGAEIILTDTGCTPEYIEHIRDYADQILEFTWCNDFAKARNLGLEAADSEWFMFIDDDEWFDDVSAIIEFFQSGEYKEYHQAVYVARNYSNLEGTAYTDSWVSRLVRIEEDTRFEGKVHECLMPTHGKCKRLDAFVHHYGYAFATEEERLLHFKRNVLILEELAEEEPDNMKWSLQLIKEYQSVKEYEKARVVAEQTLKKMEDIDTSFVNMCRGSFFLTILNADYAKIQEVEALQQDEMIQEEGALLQLEEKLALLRGMLWDRYQEFLADVRNPWNVRCAMAVFMLLNVADEEIDHLEFCADEYVHSLAKYQDEERSEQEQIIAESIVFVQEYMMRIPQLIESMQVGLQNNGDFLHQPIRVWQLAQMGIIPLEEMFLSLPVSQWMVQMVVLQRQGYTFDWEQVSKHLASICTRNDIRYCYFDKVTETTKMKTIYTYGDNVDKMDYSTMTQVITEFAQANLNYMDFLYTEHAFEGDMELLMPEEKAAVWLANGLSIGLSQWREKIQCFGNAAKVWPELGALVKRYIQYVGDAVKEQLD